MSSSADDLESARLQALADLHVLDTAPEPDFDDLARLATRLVGVEIATITLVDRTRQWFKAVVGLALRETPREIAFCAHTIARTGPLVVPDARADARFAANPLVTGAPHLRFYAGLPLVTAQGHAVGTLAVMDPAPRQLSAEQLDSLHILARQALHLLELRRSVHVAPATPAAPAPAGAAAKRQEGDERFRVIFELSAVGTAIVGLDGRWLLVNRQLCDILGYPEEELYRRTFQSMTHPDDVDGSAARLRSLMAGEIESYSVEKRYLRADGTPVWTRITVAMVRKPDGTPGYFITAMADIDAQKQAQLQLMESEFRYRQMFESSPQPMWVGDRETRKFIDVNSAAVAHYGYSREEFLALDLVDIRAPEIRDTPLESLAAPAPGAELRKYVRRHRRKDGAMLHSVISVQWLDYRGRPAIVVLVNDITALIEAEQRVLRLNAELEERVRERTGRLEQANKELEAFTYSVAHDLRAPLRAIHGFSRLLIEDESERLSDDGKASLGRVLKASAVMEEIIDDLLAYSRIEREAAEVGAIELAPLCQSIISSRAEEAAEAGIEIICAMPPLRVRATHGGLILALRNLLDNAIKFSREAHPPRIELGAEVADGYCTLRVRDNGIGFEMVYHDKIFEIFQRLHRADAYSGTGIGLAIVRKAVERMGGDVWAESAPGQGATFYLRLPLAE